jgi:hypothetical protein
MFHETVVTILLAVNLVESLPPEDWRKVQTKRIFHFKLLTGLTLKLTQF